MIRKRFATVLLAWLLACAPSIRDTATQVAVASKGIADQGAKTWVSYVDRQIEVCRAKELPTPQEREKCLGPAAKTNEVMLAFEAVHAAQLVLFVALTQDDDQAVMDALRDLAAKVKIVQKQLQAAGLLGGV